MANTTFTGNVRQNGDGNRTSVAGSVEVCAQFHIADFQTAGVRSATKSSTNLTDVLIPKNALISKVQVTCTNAGAANTFDLGLVGVVAGVLDADALVDGGATTNAAIGTYFPGFSFPGASGAAAIAQLCCNDECCAIFVLHLWDRALLLAICQLDGKRPD